MIKAMFRLSESDKQRIFKLRESGVGTTDIGRRFGISATVVSKIIQSQRKAIAQHGSETQQNS